mgnify:CR=1 FL=1
MNTTETAKPHQWIAWTGTAILLIAATMASFNLYPWYSYAFCLANAIWVLVGILWKDRALMLLNGVGIILFLNTLIRHLVGV